MIEKYKVLDMSLFYSSIPEEQMYFVLSSESYNSEKVTQKIKIAKRRFISLEYEENEIVQVLIKDNESGTYESIQVPVKEGNYRVDLIVSDIFSNAKVVTEEEWDSTIDYLDFFANELTLSDNVVMIDKKILLTSRKMRVLDFIEIEDSDLYLEKIHCAKSDIKDIEGLFDKCISGNSLCADDFNPLIDNLISGESAIIEFNGLIFSVNDSEIVARMFVGVTDDVNEEFQFRISTSRVGGMVSILFDKLVNSDPIEKKMKFLSDKIIY